MRKILLGQKKFSKISTKMMQGGESSRKGKDPIEGKARGSYGGKQGSRGAREQGGETQLGSSKSEENGADPKEEGAI